MSARDERTPGGWSLASAADAVAGVPPGRWAVGVSGGADSVALLLLLRDRSDLALHVAHLDHETRSGASADDARFVADLAARLALPCTIARRSDVEPDVPELPANLSARFRAARLALFRRVVRAHDLAGVVLAHHADDQAETVLHRLLRGSAPSGLAGMSAMTTVGGLAICRPLLGVRRDALRAVLAARGQAWRDDASNDSDDYLRNRLRRALAGRADLVAALLELGESCRALREWLRARTPNVADVASGAGGTGVAELRCDELSALPPPLARELARRWLAAAGVPVARVGPAVVDRLLAMAADAAAAARQHFPARLLVRRARGRLTGHADQD